MLQLEQQTEILALTQVSSPRRLTQAPYKVIAKLEALEGGDGGSRPAPLLSRKS